MQNITNFRGKYGFLSNFYVGVGGDVTIKRIRYASSEHAFQAGKFVKRSHRRAVANCATPGDSKRYARALAVDLGGNRAGWKTADVSIFWMLKVLRIKFSHPLMCEKLLATGDAELIEGNIWGDDFWGKVRLNGTGPWVGENWLGKILMHIRKELQTGKRSAFLPSNHRKSHE